MRKFLLALTLAACDDARPLIVESTNTEQSVPTPDAGDAGDAGECGALLRPCRVGVFDCCEGLVCVPAPMGDGERCEIGG